MAKARKGPSRIEDLLDGLEKKDRPGNDAVPNFQEFLGQLVVAFGGPDSLAREFFETYRDSKPGSPARVQLMLKLSELLLRNTQHFGAPRKIEEMSDEELVAAVSAFMKSVPHDSTGPAAGPSKTAGQ